MLTTNVNASVTMASSLLKLRALQAAPFLLVEGVPVATYTPVNALDVVVAAELTLLLDAAAVVAVIAEGTVPGIPACTTTEGAGAFQSFASSYKTPFMMTPSLL